jgi:hypothetical protein
MGHAAPALDQPDRRRLLLERVEDLWQRGVITGELLTRAREGDFVIVIDFVESRFDVSLLPRASLVEAVPADCTDAVLLEMTNGQPARVRGEDIAAWCFSAEWESEKPVLEIHFAWRAWRDAHGAA